MKMRLFVISLLLVFGFPFIMTELDSFSKCLEFFSEDQPPEITGIPEASDSKRYKLICQEYKGSNRFATLYDTTNKIPVFSAYKYTKKEDGSITRSNNWRSEPKLSGDQQAKDSDYKNNGIKMSRGHLFPNGHAADQETAESTFTLTNAVPQQEKFNNGIWSQKEETLKKIMNETCRDSNGKVVAHVLTGAIPGKEKMKEKVNIPSHMWMAFCCYNSKEGKWVSQAYCATNEENSKAKLNNERLSDLHTFLEKNFKQTKLFHDKCK